MSNSSIKSLVQVKIGKLKVPVIPLDGLKYFAISIGTILLGLIGIEKVILPVMESRGQVVSRDWVREDRKIDLNNRERNQARGDWKNAPAKGNWIWRSQGYPIPEVSSKPHRILVMGDSYVWGDGYANLNDIWWRQLQRELVRRGYTQVEVIGAGINGASTRAQLEQARRLVPKYRPDLIIWGYVSNDPDEIQSGKSVVKRLDQETITNSLEDLANQGIFPHLTQQLYNLRMQALKQIKPTDKNGFLYDEWQLQLLKGENATLYQDTLRALSEFQKSTQIPGFSVTLPAYPNRRYFSERYELVKPFFAKSGVKLFDILPEYIQWSKNLVDGRRFPKLQNDPLWGINPADGHPGTSSTYFFGRTVADILTDKYTRVLGIRSESSETQIPQINDWLPSQMDVKIQNHSEVSFVYPSVSDKMLSLPVNRPFVQFNLSMPLPFKAISLSGEGLTEATLDVTYIRNDQPFDDHTIHTVSTQTGHNITWRFVGQNAQRSINTIRFSAKVKPSSRQLTLRLVP